MVLHGAVLSVVIGLIVLQSDRVITQRLEAGLNRNLADDAPEFVQAALARPPGQSLAEFTRAYLRAHNRGQKFLLIVGASAPGGTAATLPASDHSAELARTEQIQHWTTNPPLQAEWVTITVGNAKFRLFAAPLSVAGTPIGTFVSGADLATLNPDRNDQLSLAVVEALAALAAAELAAFLLLRRVLRTVNTVTAAADEARTGNLAQRLHYSGPGDEVGRLARTMDAMLGQLDAAFTAQRRLLADVSHQLRTPITIARGHLEVLSRTGDRPPAEQYETVAVVLDELTQLSMMVERLLFLGQALEPDFLMEDSVALPDLIDELFDAARVMANREWSLSAVPDVLIRADGAKLRGAILNLMDNAVKATTDDDSICLRIRLDEELIIEVCDTGRGIAVADQPVIFDRFRRSEASKYGGNGLGLAIVKAVAEAHGGRVELKSELGRGSTFAMVLPADRVHRQARPLVGTSP